MQTSGPVYIYIYINQEEPFQDQPTAPAATLGQRKGIRARRMSDHCASVVVIQQHASALKNMWSIPTPSAYAATPTLDGNRKKWDFHPRRLPGHDSHFPIWLSSGSVRWLDGPFQSLQDGESTCRYDRVFPQTCPPTPCRRTNGGSQEVRRPLGPGLMDRGAHQNQRDRSEVAPKTITQWPIPNPHSFAAPQLKGQQITCRSCSKATRAGRDLVNMVNPSTRPTCPPSIGTGRLKRQDSRSRYAIDRYARHSFKMLQAQKGGGLKPVPTLDGPLFRPETIRAVRSTRQEFRIRANQRHISQPRPTNKLFFLLLFLPNNVGDNLLRRRIRPFLLSLPVRPSRCTGIRSAVRAFPVQFLQ